MKRPKSPFPPQMFTRIVEMQTLKKQNNNNSLHPHRYSNEDFIVIISCCYVPRCRRDMLCTDLLSAIELSSLMNLSGVNDSGWGNVVYKTGRRLVWVLC